MSDRFLLMYGLPAFNIAAERSDIRAFCRPKPPERDKDGKILYVTEQAHKLRCDVNHIVKTYTKTGLLEHVTRFEASYGDVTGDDFKAMCDKVVAVQSKFDEFPASIREKFDNDPAKFLSFFDNPANADAALAMGLTRADWLKNSKDLKQAVVDPGKPVVVDPGKLASD